MLNYTDIKPGVVLDIDGNAFIVIKTSGVVKKQRQKPHNTAKIRNIKTGATVEKTFTQSDKVAEAALETRQITYLYTHKSEHMFCDPVNKSDRFSLSEALLGSTLDYTVPQSLLDARIFNDEIIGIVLPNKVNLTVTEAPPNIRGNTSAGGNKVVVLETGLKITTPLFINTGDMVRVNTETGIYSERVVE